MSVVLYVIKFIMLVYINFSYDFLGLENVVLKITLPVNL